MRAEDLRPHQVRAVELLRQGWKRHDTHLINAPAGAGKTAIASYLCQKFAEAGQKVIFAAPYITLVNQTYERFQQYGHRDLSVIWRQDARHDPSCLVQIASADTLIRRDFPDDVKVLLWDETHVKRAKLIELMQSGQFKTVGLSATPFAKWMGSIYQNLIKPCTSRQLAELGLLTPFDILSPAPPQMPAGAKMRTNEFGEKDFDPEISARIMGTAKIVGDIVGTWLDHGDNEPTIGFAPNVSTANAYTLAFQRAGVTAEVITAETPLEERGPMFARFNSGATKVLWNVGVLGAGFDADVRCIIWARPTKSETVWLQGTMRGSRPAPGKDHGCKLFDHAGTYWSLGDPFDIEYFELHDGTAEMEAKRQAKKEKTEKESKSKVCPACGHVKAVGEYVCSRCGHKPLGGEVTVEVDESRGLERVKGEAKKKGMSQEEKAIFYRQLLGYQVQRAHDGKSVSDGFIAHLYRDKTGVWPRGIPKEPLPPGPEALSWIKHRQIKFAKARAK